MFGFPFLNKLYCLFLWYALFYTCCYLHIKGKLNGLYLPCYLKTAMLNVVFFQALQTFSFHFQVLQMPFCNAKLSLITMEILFFLSLFSWKFEFCYWLKLFLKMPWGFPFIIIIKIKKMKEHLTRMTLSPWIDIAKEWSLCYDYHPCQYPFRYIS